MDFDPFRPAQEYDQNTPVVISSMFQESLVGCNKKTVFLLRQFPQFVIVESLLAGMSDILGVVTVFQQPSDRPSRDVLVDEDLHFFDSTSTSKGMFSSSVNSPA